MRPATPLLDFDALGAPYLRIRVEPRQRPLGVRETPAFEYEGVPVRVLTADPLRFAAATVNAHQQARRRAESRAAVERHYEAE